MVLIPEMIGGIAHHQHQDQMNQKPTDGELLPLCLLPFHFFHLPSYIFLLPYSLHHSQEHQRGHQNIIRYIEGRQLLIHPEHRQTRPPDIVDAGLTEHIIIIEQGPEHNRQHGNHRADDTICQRQMLQTPQEDTHQQRCQQAVEAYQRIEHTRRDKHIDGTQIILRRQ